MESNAFSLDGRSYLTLIPKIVGMRTTHPNVIDLLHRQLKGVALSSRLWKSFDSKLL